MNNNSEFNPTNKTGRPMPRMVVVVSCMKKQNTPYTEGCRAMLNASELYISEDNRVVAVVGKEKNEETGKEMIVRKVVAKASKGDTPDREKGIYIALVKYLTNWNNNKLETYFTRRVPKLERTIFNEFCEKRITSLTETLKAQKVDAKVIETIVATEKANLEKQRDEARSKIEKDIALEVILKLTEFQKEQLDAYIKSHDVLAIKKAQEQDAIAKAKAEAKTQKEAKKKATNINDVKLNPEFVEFFGQMIDAYNESKKTTTK
jgi:hypothetical protein